MYGIYFTKQISCYISRPILNLQKECFMLYCYTHESLLVVCTCFFQFYLLGFCGQLDSGKTAKLPLDLWLDQIDNSFWLVVK